jgi:RNA polymerase-binding transcription factor DksA
MEIVRQARQLFWFAIEQLEQSCKLEAMSQKLANPAKTKLLEQRRRLLQEARESAEHMQTAVDSFRNLADQQQERDIDRLQQELNLSIQAAQRSEERMRELESKPDYEAFLREGP